MIYGISAGILWALETVVLGIALSMMPAFSGGRGLFLAPFVSTFIHDAFSAFYMWIYNGVRGNLRDVFRLFRTKDFIYLVISSAIGGPVGMTGYVIAVNYAGSAIGAVASAVYPAIGSVLAWIFLKEKIRRRQWIFLFFTLMGVFGLSFSSDVEVKNFWLGLSGAFMCAFGWGIEGVIVSKCLKGRINSDCALLIRQSVSAAIYGFIIISLLHGIGFTASLFNKENISALLIIAAAALFASASYLSYYRAIAKAGVSKAMGLNITYTAWTIVFSVILLRDFSILRFETIACCTVVVICGILAAADFDELFPNFRKDETEEL